MENLSLGKWQVSVLGNRTVLLQYLVKSHFSGKWRLPVVWFKTPMARMMWLMRLSNLWEILEDIIDTKFQADIGSIIATPNHIVNMFVLANELILEGMPYHLSDKKDKVLIFNGIQKASCFCSFYSPFKKIQISLILCNIINRYQPWQRIVWYIVLSSKLFLFSPWISTPLAKPNVPSLPNARFQVFFKPFWLQTYSILENNPKFSEDDDKKNIH